MADGRAEGEKAKRPQPAGGEHVAPLVAELWGGSGVWVAPAGVGGPGVPHPPVNCPGRAVPGPAGRVGGLGLRGLCWRRGRVGPAVLSFTGAFVKIHQLLLVRAMGYFSLVKIQGVVVPFSKRNTTVAVCKDEDSALKINFQQL